MKVSRTMNKTYDWQHCTECGEEMEEVSDGVYYCKKCDLAFTKDELFAFWKKQDEHNDYDRMRDNEL